MQRELAARLGVSQTPVRASLGRLQREGFVAVGSTGPRLRQQADARGLRGDLRRAARARGARGQARRGGGRPGRAREDAGDAGQARAGRGEAGRRRVPRAPLGVLRHLLPRERPAAPRRGGRAALLALRTVQPSRALDRADGSRSRSAATRPSSRTARRATGSPPSATSRTASAGRSTAPRAACRPKRTSRERRVQRFMRCERKRCQRRCQTRVWHRVRDESGTVSERV